MINDLEKNVVLISLKRKHCILKIYRKLLPTLVKNYDNHKFLKTNV